ncbi:uncharacterized protein LOC144066032 [Stigmatopora argus]
MFDSKCPICLDRFKNMAYLNSCRHRFCSGCIQEWSHTKAECPLCKQPFASILQSDDGQKNKTCEEVKAAPVELRRTRWSRRKAERDALRVTEECDGGGGDDWAPREFAARLAARLRTQREGSEPRRLSASETLAFRRGLYLNGIRAHLVPGVGPASPPRDVTADGFRSDPAPLDRLRTWLRRELTVLLGPRGGGPGASFHRLVIRRLVRHGLEDGGGDAGDAADAEEELRSVLSTRTHHFLHELRCFARSPLSMDEYDLRVQYHPPAGDPDPDPPPGEEPPGPSNASAPTSEPPSPVQGEDETDCVIVGYKKPLAERTPELVHLSSDSESPSPLAPPSDACPETEAPPTSDKTTKKKRMKMSPKRLATPSPEPAPDSLLNSSWVLSSSPSPSPSPYSVHSCSPPPSHLWPPYPGDEKPRGKMKSKSRHLKRDGDAKRRGRGRDKKSQSAGKHRRPRSPSVEIVYEGAAPSKRRRETQPRDRLPIIITLDSDSDDDDDRGLSNETPKRVESVSPPLDVQEPHASDTGSDRSSPLLCSPSSWPCEVAAERDDGAVSNETPNRVEGVSPPLDVQEPHASDTGSDRSSPLLCSPSSWLREAAAAGDDGLSDEPRTSSTRVARTPSPLDLQVSESGGDSAANPIGQSPPPPPPHLEESDPGGEERFSLLNCLIQVDTATGSEPSAPPSPSLLVT